MTMGYTPTQINVDQKGFSFTATFTLTNRHEVRYSKSLTNYRLYVDGQEIQHEEMESCRFRIEGVDCYFGIGLLGPKLEVGGAKIRLMKW
jgi:hypothetical protein